MFLDDERVILNSTFYILNLLKGIYSYGDPPLPIPNREVKPVSADGTAPGWESRSMPNLERASSTNPLFFLFCLVFNFQLSDEPVTCEGNFFHYLCVYENSDKYNIDRINLVSFIHGRYLFNRGKD